MSLKGFDFYPKLQDELKVKTLSGGAVSIVATICIAVLFVSELIHYLPVKTTDHVYVDTSRTDDLHINFDITMHHLPCTLVSIDAKDVLGEHQTNVQHHVHKHRLDKDGNHLGDDPVKIELKQTLDTNELKELHKKGTEGGGDNKGADKAVGAPKCLSCFGAETRPGQCCNTCMDLRSAYTARGWALDSIRGTEQCKGEADMRPHYKELDDKEGCRLTGYLSVGKVAGNFHVSPGRTHEVNHLHVYDLGAFQDGAFDIGHTIHSLSFGEQFPGSHNPLDNTTKAVGREAALAMYQYYIKVVPTKYNHIGGKTILSNQFSYTEHLRLLPSLQALKPGNLPGIFINYDFSPMKVEITESRPPLTHFVTQMCAILGGVFTVAGMVDQILYQSMKQLQKKVELGKLS